jgi:hypothetical protein
MASVWIYTAAKGTGHFLLRVPLSVTCYTCYAADTRTKQVIVQKRGELESKKVSS